MKKIIQDSMYLVTPEGKVFSLFTNKFLKLSQSQTGYLVVNIRVDGKRQPFYVHRLVAEAYIENVDSKPFVNHKDGNKHNNTKENLEWVTDLENKIHAQVIGLVKNGERLPQSKLTDADVHYICKLLSAGISCGKIAKELGTNRSVILNIRARRDWEHISCNYSWPIFTNRRNSLAKTCND